MLKIIIIWLKNNRNQKRQVEIKKSKNRCEEDSDEDNHN